jgi:hypothetical protein
MANGDLHALLTVLVLPLGHLREVHPSELSHTPFELLLEGFLRVRVRPASFYFKLRQLTNSENVV